MMLRDKEECRENCPSDSPTFAWHLCFHLLREGHKEPQGMLSAPLLLAFCSLIFDLNVKGSLPEPILGRNFHRSRISYPAVITASPLDS